MDQHARKYYRSYSDVFPQGRFHRVIELNEDPLIEWNEAFEMAPRLCRGWYELAQLPVQDRIEFTREFWLAKLPYHQQLNPFLTKFFSGVDDIAIFFTQNKFEDPFEVHFVYSLAKNGGFFHGELPATDLEIIDLQKKFPGFILPADYLAFLQIHNGFAKLDDTGICKSSEMATAYENFQKLLEKAGPIVTANGNTVNPSSLIPFYQSFGMSFFQCFWGEWYPDQEMGNVYYSSTSGTISDCTKSNDCVDTMAFATFEEWLMFYLEKLD